MGPAATGAGGSGEAGDGGEGGGWRGGWRVEGRGRRAAGMCVTLSCAQDSPQPGEQRQGRQKQKGDPVVLFLGKERTGRGEERRPEEAGGSRSVRVDHAHLRTSYAGSSH